MAGSRIDYHVHTPLCRHAEGEMEAFVQQAHACGLKEIAFTDHIPMTHPVLKDFCMYPKELEGYVERVLRLREDWRGMIEVKLGIEADYVEGTEAYVRGLLDTYPFDLVLGSVHVVDGWGIDNEHYLDRYENGNIEEIFYAYFQHLERAAKSGLFDVMAHPDLVKKFDYFPDLDDYSDLYEDALNAIVSMGVAMELSSGGLRKPVSEQYPSEPFLRRAVERGVHVVTGSDAHTPAEVGFAFDRLYGLLAEVGVTEVLTFTRRKRAVLPINS